VPEAGISIKLGGKKPGKIEHRDTGEASFTPLKEEEKMPGELVGFILTGASY